MSEIKDIFKGEYFDVWGDEEFVTINFPFVAVTLSKEEWEAFKKDIGKLNDL